jgi:hypothetical protein
MCSSFHLCSLEFGGIKDPATKKELIPPLLAHYSTFHAQQECLQRYLPVAVVVFHAHLKISHSGLTMDAVLKLDDALFGQLFSQMCHIACDPGLCPYQPDEAISLDLTPEGFGLGLRATENIVSFT